VADHDGRKAGSIEQQLYEDGSRFTFLQAVRLLEEIELRDGGRGRCEPPGEAAHADRELLFFRHVVRLDVPPSDVETIERAPGEPPRVSVNVLGVAGLLGPLPHAVTETILGQLRQGRRAFADFLDIFNHRLLSLLYRARKKYRPALDPKGPHDGRMARVLGALLGLGTPSLRGRVLANGSADRPLLAYAGLFAEHGRSPVGLERILEDFFDVPAAVVPFVGAWDEIDDDDLTALGARLGRNNVLGRTALAGRRLWNQAARFEVRLGPLGLGRFRSFLPAATDAYAPLMSLVRFYAHDELGFRVRLVLRAADVPRLRLRAAGDAYLGQTTWLSRRPPARDDEQVRLVGRR
jgi:type VI secretion system protein ImpH